MSNERDTSLPPGADKTTTFDVALYPRSADFLLAYVAQAAHDAVAQGLPQYVEIDICNFRTQLEARLQRVARGE